MTTTHHQPPTFTGLPIPKTFADYQKLALQQKDQAQKVSSRDGKITQISESGVRTPTDTEAEVTKRQFPRLRRVECHEKELEEKELREGLLGAEEHGLERKHVGLKRKAEGFAELFRK